MSTINNRIKNVLTNFIKKLKRPKLKASPQKKATVIRVRIATPRKPNSAKRTIIKGFASTKKYLLAHIPGSGHSLKKHSRILFNGNGLRDVPVVNYTCIRGVFDLGSMQVRKRRSIYGLKKTPDLKIFIRRKLRNKT